MGTADDRWKPFTGIFFLGKSGLAWLMIAFLIRIICVTDLCHLSVLGLLAYAIIVFIPSNYDSTLTNSAFTSRIPSRPIGFRKTVTYRPPASSGPITAICTHICSGT